MNYDFVFSPDFKKRFLSLPGEMIVLTTRTHAFALVMQIIFALFIAIFFCIISYVAFNFIDFSPFLLAESIAIILLVAAGILTKLFIDWYFHVYIVTTHKIVEVFFTPLFSHAINDVLLDQVRCTEVDVRTNNFLDEICNMGDVIITFDRPTHQDAFTIASIANPDMVGATLADALDVLRSNTSNELWMRNKKTNRLQLMEEIFPRASI